MKFYRLILGILLFLFLQTPHALAQGGEPPIPSAPTNGNVVLDTLNWLTPLQEEEINTINQKLDNEGIAQIAVVTLDDCGEDKQKFRNELFRTWGIGHANDNDGLLILVCWYGGDQSHRSVEQETGYGLEGTLPDVLTARVATENFMPAFKANQPGNGLVSMVRKYNSILRQRGENSKPILATIQPQNIYVVYSITGILGIFPGLVLSILYERVWKSFKTVAKNRNKKFRRRKKREIKTETGEKYIYEKDFEIIDSHPDFREVMLANRNIPSLREGIAFEILALLPVLMILYGIMNAPELAANLRAYSQTIGSQLFIWLIVLSIVFILMKIKEVANFGDINWDWTESRNNNWSPSDNRSDSSRDSFGGGSSGGGGSSTKF